MATDDLTDADVLAELREDERDWFNPDDPMLDHEYPNWSNSMVNEACRRLALARREAREAAAVERERIAAEMLEHATVLRERRGMHTNGPADTCRHQIANALESYVRNVLRARGQS